MSGFLERMLDQIFEYQEIRAGCEADSNNRAQSVYLKRYFIVKGYDPNRSAGAFHVPRFSLTVRRATNGAQVYLHKIMRSDADRELHDHPWSFLSLILWRGYREETEHACGVCGANYCQPTRLSRKWPGMVLWRPAEHRHRVHIGPGPAWTLVFTSGKKRSWGFWRAGRFVPWRQFVARKCDPEAA